MKHEKFSNLVTRFPWLFIVIFLGVTAFFAVQLPNTKMDTEMKNQLPRDLPTRLNLEKIEKLFGGTDMAMIVISADDILAPDTLARISKISKAMERVPELERIVSLSTAKDIRSDMGEMVVEKVIRRLPKNQAAVDDLRKKIKNNDLVYGNLISKDFKHTGILGFLTPDAEDKALIDKLEKILKDNPGPEESYVAGMPLTRVSLAKDIRADMKKFLPVGLLLMVIFLFICFRQARGVLLPFLMTVMSIVAVMGLIPLLGWKVHTVTVILPVILLAVANNYGIHILARYQEDNVPDNRFSAKQLAQIGISKLAYPVLATGVTTIAGLLCLISHIIIPAAQLGILAAAGTAFAMFGSLMFIPAVLSILKKAKPVLQSKEAREKSGAFLDKVLGRTAQAVYSRPKTIFIGFVVFSAVMAVGAVLIVVDTNPMSVYAKDHPIWRSTHLLNDKLGGWAGVSIIAEGDIQSPEVLREIDKLETHLKENKLVSNTSSIAQIMRKMNQIMHDGDKAFDKIPETKELAAQYFLLYSMSASSDDLSKLVDFDYKHAQIIARINDSGTAAAAQVVNDINAYLSAHKKAPFTLAGGFLDVLSNMVSQIVKGQLLSLFISFFVIAVLVAILMRSVVAGIFSMMPLMLASAVLFGLMGLLGIELNLVTAMLSSIMMGVGVDYTIHFMWRYRDERRAGADIKDAVRGTLITTGRGIVFNAFSVAVGFAVLVVSAFFPVRFFGLLVVVSITACLVGALVLLPAMAAVFKPKFLDA